MKRLILAASLLAVATVVQAPAVIAADLDRDDPRADVYRGSGSPYDDPRYGDIYRHPDPPRRYGEPRYEEPRYEDRRYDERPYLPPMRGPRGECNDCERNPPPPLRRYSEVEPRYDAPRYEAPRYEGSRYDAPRFSDRGPNCLARAEIRHSLVREGWRDFHDPALSERVAWLSARRPRGQLYRLKLDRCSGEILKAQAIDAPTPAPWAYGPRRYDRQYWN